MMKSFKELLKEALGTDAPPLDFGASDVEDKFISDVPTEKKPKSVKSGYNFLGQPVRSEIVVKELQKYMSDIRSILKTQFANSIKDNTAIRQVRPFIDGPVFRRVKTASPVTNLSLLDQGTRGAFEAFLQELLHGLYMNMIRNPKFMKMPRIKFTMNHVDMEDEVYAKSIIQGLAQNLASKLSLLDTDPSKIPNDLLSLYKEFRDVIKNRKVSKAKKRKNRK